MSAVPAISTRRVDLLGCFMERASARAYLWSIGEYSLHEAVDVLQHDAEREGLTARAGQDAVQKILSNAFAPYRSHEDSADYEAPAVTPEPTKRPTPRTAIEAIMWCVRERGPQALHEPDNIERLSRCDEAAISEIDRRTAKLEAVSES